MFNWMLGRLRKVVGRSYLEGRSYVRGRAPNLNRLSRARKYLAFSLIQFSRNSQSCVCLIGCSAIEKGCGKVVSYIRNFLTEEGNWILNKVKNKGKKAPSLNRLNRARKMEKTSPSTPFSVRAILNRVYVQLDARPIEEGYREVVCSWEASNLN